MSPISKNPHKVIVMDVDGVIADFIKPFSKIIQKKWPELVPELMTTEEQEIIDKVFPENAKAYAWSIINTTSWWWIKIPSLVDANTFRRINRLASYSCRLYFVTNRTSFCEPPELQTAIWLRNHGVLNPNVIVTRYKWDICKTLKATHALEDLADNVRGIEVESPDTKAFLIDRKYNRIPHMINSLRVNTVDDFLDVVEYGE